MKSILRQLAKYKQKPEESTQIVVPEWADERDFDIEQLAKIVAPSLDRVPEFVKKLGDMPTFKGMGILYPVTTLARYHLYYRHATMTSELLTDAEIIRFVKSVDKVNYREQFAKLCDKEVVRATLIRCLLATFDGFDDPKDRLPKELRPQICSKLGVQQNITLSQTVKLQENLKQERFSIEQQILSRLGYVMIWNSLQDNDTEVLLIGHIPSIPHRDT